MERKKNCARDKMRNKIKSGVESPCENLRPLFVNVVCVCMRVCLLSLEKQGVSEYGSGLSERGTEVGQEIEVFVFLSCSCREHKGLSKGRAGGRGREGRRDREGVKQGGASGKTREGMGKAREK